MTPLQIVQENTRRKQQFKPGRKKKKTLRLIKDPYLPKKPRTPYINYVIEHMQTEADEKGKERVKELAYDWKNVLTPEDKKVNRNFLLFITNVLLRLLFYLKKPYEEAYQKDKLRYEEEMKAYKDRVTGLIKNV